jgi:hypothetical protein
LVIARVGHIDRRVEAREAQLLTKIREKGGHAGNATLQKEMNWGSRDEKAA